jgi:hypothetical protein
LGMNLDERPLVFDLDDLLVLLLLGWAAAEEGFFLLGRSLAHSNDQYKFRNNIYN